MDRAAESVPGAASTHDSQLRPGWWWTIGCLLLAYVISVAAIALVAYAASPLRTDFSILEGSWPWQPDGAWAIVAGASPLVLVALLFAVSLRLAVEWRGEWKLRLTPVVVASVALALLTTGTTGNEQPRAWLLVGMLLLTRYVAIVPQRGPWLPSRWLLVLFGAVALLLTAVTVAYRPLHPLNVQVGDRSPGAGPHWGFEEGGGYYVPFAIANKSFANARIVSATPVADGAPVVVQLDNTAPEFAFADMYLPVPAAGVALSSDGEASGRIRLVPGTCRAGGSHLTDLRSFDLRVETLGRTRTQRVELSPAIVLRCR